MRDSPEGFWGEKSGNLEKRPSGEDNGGTACHIWPVELREPGESNGHDNYGLECSTPSEGRWDEWWKPKVEAKHLLSGPVRTPRLTQVRITET